MITIQSYKKLSIYTPAKWRWVRRKCETRQVFAQMYYVVVSDRKCNNVYFTRDFEMYYLRTTFRPAFFDLHASLLWFHRRPFIVFGKVRYRAHVNVLRKAYSRLRCHYFQAVQTTTYLNIFYMFYQFYCFQFSSFGMRAGTAAEPTIFDLSNTQIPKVVRATRRFLLACGQNKVRISTEFWHKVAFWRKLVFYKETANIFSYRHIVQSDKIPAALILNHPNYFLFTTIMSNPYFWGLLQPVFFSKYKV